VVKVIVPEPFQVTSVKMVIKVVKGRTFIGSR
jgi:hypothetical protein